MSYRAVQLVDVGKRYVKYEDTPLILTSALRLRNRSRRSALWAIRHVDVEIEPGSSLGVVGRNGSGKSTLLRMLAGVTAPSEGSVRVRGRVAPLISVGVGFHPELTGRENVYVNGTVLGLGRRQLDARFDEIVAFAEIEEFLDTPVKFYSSGMFVRLGFAVAVVAQPDVLLVDEVLAVGDLAFQLKCFDRMKEIQASGTTLVTVSHNLSAVRRLCSRALVVHDGTVRYDGHVDEAISLYHELLGEERELEGAAVDEDHRAVVGGATILSCELLGADGAPTAHVQSGDMMTFRVHARADRDIAAPVVGFGVAAESGISVYAEGSALTTVPAVGAGRELVCQVVVPARLPTGSYTASLSVRDASVRLAVTKPLLFYVSGNSTARGLADLGAEFSVQAVPVSP